MTEKRKGRWKPGVSGNPNGRPAGSGSVAKLRDGIAEHIPEIIAKMVIKAKAGDVLAAKLLLERVIPQLKPIDTPVNINLPDNAGLSEQGELIIQSVADGTLTPSQGGALLTSISSLVRIKEVDELEERLAKLEELNDDLTRLGG